MKFLRYLLLPTTIVVVYWILGIPTLFLPESFFSSYKYGVITVGIITFIVGLFVFLKLIFLIVNREYKNALAVIIGIPIAVIIGFLSIILLLGFTGI